MKNVFYSSQSLVLQPHIILFLSLLKPITGATTSLFFEQINANPGMKILNADLTVAQQLFGFYHLQT